MANDKLENLVKIGQLKAEQATREEIAGLVKSGVGILASARPGSSKAKSRGV